MTTIVAARLNNRIKITAKPYQNGKEIQVKSKKKKKRKEKLERKILGWMTNWCRELKRRKKKAKISFF